MSRIRGLSYPQQLEADLHFLCCSSQHSLQHVASRLVTLADAAASVQATAEQATQAAQQTAASGNSGGFFGPIAKAFEVSLAVSRDCA